MLNKLIKRGKGKPSKPDAPNSGDPSAPHESTVTVNLASRSVAPAASSASAAASAGGNAASGSIASLPLFRDVPAPERPALFIRKLQICAVLFDFSDNLRLAREKETKRQTLLEIADFIQSGSAGKLPENVQEEFARAVSANVFRSLPPASHENTGSSEAAADPEEEEPYLDPCWPHLQLVYEMLLRYISSNDTDTKVAKKFIDHSFVLRLLDLFDTEDQREREYVKMVIHRIYGRFMVHRPFLRRAINNVLYRFIFETQRHCGIAELLEVLGSIINGFAMPMKEEHKLFLGRVLIPLHKPKPLSTYHQQLSYCITQFVEKDYTLADTVIRGLLKYWPLINCGKEVMFLNELEEVLEATQPAEFQLCMVPLFKQIARCLNSPHFQVSERALFLWNNDHIVSLIAQNRNAILPIIFEALEKNTKNHWNQAVHGLTANVRKMFMDMDAELFEECQQQFAEKEAKTKELQEQREQAWRTLEAAVAAKASGEEILVN